MREKLIELLQDCICDYVSTESYDWWVTYEVKYEELADHLIANGVTLDNQVSSSKWISVKDMLPEKKGTFLVCTKNDFYCTKNIAKVRFYDGEWHGTGGVWSNVTHWMEMPQPPKGE